MGNNMIPRIIFRCDYCGKWHSSMPSHYKLKVNHFCSRKCYSIFRTEILPKEAQHAYKNGGFSIKEKKRRLKARGALNHEIKKGRIQRLPCSKCGNKNSQGHHTDYSKPFEVEWLCVKCHGKEHRRIHKFTELINNQKESYESNKDA